MCPKVTGNGGLALKMGLRESEAGAKLDPELLVRSAQCDGECTRVQTSEDRREKGGVGLAY